MHTRLRITRVVWTEVKQSWIKVKTTRCKGLQIRPLRRLCWLVGVRGRSILRNLLRTTNCSPSCWKKWWQLELKTPNWKRISKIELLCNKTYLKSNLMLMQWLRSIIKARTSSMLAIESTHSLSRSGVNQSCRYKEARWHLTFYWDIRSSKDNTIGHL